MAGYRTVFASEFVDAARETYEANFPGVPVDPRDVREITGDSIREATGLSAFDVLEGSPPCASFSVSGRREQTWDQERHYSDGKVQRVDDLFFEFVRLLREIGPRAFVAENVEGLVIGKAKGYFLRVEAAMKTAGYRVEARVVDAQWLGVPQRRKRVLFVGLRDDVDATFEWPKPLPYRYSLEDAFVGLSPSAETGEGDGRYEDRDPSGPEGIGTYAIGEEWGHLTPGDSSDRYPNLVRPRSDAPSPTVTAAGGGAGTAAVTHPTERRKFRLDELRRVCGFPDDFVLTGNYRQQWERLGRAVPPPMMRAIAEKVADALIPADTS